MKIQHDIEKDDACVKCWLMDMHQHDCGCKADEKELVPCDDIFAQDSLIGYKCSVCDTQYSIHLDIVKRSSFSDLLKKYFESASSRYRLEDNLGKILFD